MSSNDESPDQIETVEILNPPPTIWACLFVAGSFDPSELSRLLGVEAKVRRAGDRLGTSKLFASADSWHLSTGAKSRWSGPR
jgi:hypothetical protein